MGRLPRRIGNLPVPGSIARRRTWRRMHVPALDDSYGRSQPIEPTIERPANCNVSSIEGSTKHAPCLDIDMPCELVPSRHAGHFHLYIDIEIPDDLYWKMLDAMADAGVLQRTWVDACKRSGTTILRLPPVEHEYEQLRKHAMEAGTPF